MNEWMNERMEEWKSNEEWKDGASFKRTLTRLASEVGKKSSVTGLWRMKKKKTEKLHMHTNLKTQGYEHGNFQEQNIKLNILKKKYV